MPDVTTDKLAPSAKQLDAGTDKDPKRWLALVVIAIAQLMIVVDTSIVNIALPAAQAALHISDADRQWVVTAYTLAFGGLLLLGGRIADHSGRKRTLIIGLLGFGGASALGGLAPDAGVLFTARAVQGAFAAIMAPAALSILSVTFTDRRERARAFGVYGSIGGGGLAVGLLLGGALTQYTSWRWCLLVNTPLAVLAAVGAVRVVNESRGDGRSRFDFPGALAATLGLVAVVYGFTEAATKGWSSDTTIGALGVGVALLSVFVLIELRSAHPLLPLRVVTERNRGGAFLVSLLSGTGLYGMFLFLTYYLQGSLGYSPLKTGLAFLPFSTGVVLSAIAASSLLGRLAPRVIMGAGLVMAAAGLLLFTQVGIHTGFLSHVLPGELIMSFGLGLVFVPISSTVLIGVAGADSGVASAMINTTQQVGGSIGVSLLNTLAASATTTYIAARLAAHHASRRTLEAAGTVHGYDVAFGIAAGFIVAALVTTVFLVTAKKEDLDAEQVDVFA